MVVAGAALGCGAFSTYWLVGLVRDPGDGDDPIGSLIGLFAASILCALGVVMLCWRGRTGWAVAGLVVAIVLAFSAITLTALFAG